MIVVSYRMKRKIKKIFLEVISKTKNFSIKSCSMKLPKTKILPNLQGDWTTPIQYILFSSSFSMWTNVFRLKFLFDNFITPNVYSASFNSGECCRNVKTIQFSNFAIFTILYFMKFGVINMIISLLLYEFFDIVNFNSLSTFLINSLNSSSFVIVFLTLTKTCLFHWFKLI